mgnify:CR=1 FL=1
MQLVMTLCMSSLMNKAIPGYDLPQGELWRHSVAVSLAAENIVQALNIPDADEVFTAALLHDVGKLILGSFVKKDLAQIEAMVTKGIAFDVAESMVLGTNHAEVGGQILHKWSFPAELVNAVQWHHDPESCENSCILSDIVHVANKVGLMTGFGKADGGIDVEPFGPVVDRLGLKASHLEAMAQLLRLFDVLTGQRAAFVRNAVDARSALLEPRRQAFENRLLAQDLEIAELQLAPARNQCRSEDRPQGSRRGGIGGRQFRVGLVLNLPAKIVDALVEDALADVFKAHQDVGDAHHEFRGAG